MVNRCDYSQAEVEDWASTFDVVHKDFQSKGIVTILLNDIERYAITAGITRVTSEVSLTARPFFEKKVI